MQRIKTTVIEPMLLLPARTLPEGVNWAYELKLDGYRALAIKTLKETNGLHTKSLFHGQSERALRSDASFQPREMDLARATPGAVSNGETIVIPLF